MKGPSFEEEPSGPGLNVRGGLDARGLRIAVIASSFNRFVTSKLAEGACQGLMASGFEETELYVAWVPGAFELPLAASEMAKSGRWDAVVCVGAVIRGETSHFDFVAGEAARGIAAASRETGVPIAFGVLTTDTEEQALERSGGKVGNKGYEAALTAIEMANLLRKVREETRG